MTNPPLHITLIDYHMGNLKSVAKAFEHEGATVHITNHLNDIQKADRLVLPGVGAFGVCMQHLHDMNLVEALQKHIESQKPFLGICLGLQALFDQSEEAKGVNGTGIIPGSVKKFNLGPEYKVPHMGWNTVQQNNSLLFNGIPQNSDFYFVHSYYVKPHSNKVEIGTTPYGHDFCSVIQKDNLVACQFHPEKSQAVGLRFLRNFLSL